MDEILYQLREHSAGLNCGRLDYLFSFIKKFRRRPDFVVPDRASITLVKHFLNSYMLLLIQTCHRRGVRAMGGIAAQIPIKNNPGARDLEDAATAEISRAQVWQWVNHQVRMTDGTPITPDLVTQTIPVELPKMRGRFGPSRFDPGKFDLAGKLLEQMMTSVELAEFIPLMACGCLD